MYIYSLFVACATFLLILAGGLVTSHEAGLAVPDWPLSYGQWFPPMVGNIFWEHGHRMIAGSVGILTLILAIAVQIYGKWTALKKLAWAAVGLVVVQAVLGGVTVLLMLPPVVSIAHACLGPTFFCLIVSIVYLLGPGANREISIAKRESIGPFLIATTGLLYLQLFLGATVRHTGHAIMPHVLAAFLVLISVLVLTLKIAQMQKEDLLLSGLSRFLGFAVLVQFFLGIGSFVFTQMLRSGYAPSGGEVLFTSAHQTLGVLILATGVVMTVRVYR